MPKRRGSRFVLEALFLAAVTAALTVGDPNAPTVVGVMLLAWLLVALFEWASWLEEPHFGRGLPPRYVVPQAALPPPRLVEQGRRAEAAPPLDRSGYPEPATDDTELTWVVGPGEWGSGAWGEVLEDWPVLDSRAVGEDTEVIALDGLELESLFDELRAEEPPAEAPGAEAPGADAPEAEPTSELELPAAAEAAALAEPAVAESPGPADSPPAADELVGPAVEEEQAPEAPVEPPAEEEPAAPLPAVAAAAAGALAGSMPAAVPPAVAEPVEVEAEPVEAEPMDGEPAVPAVALPVIAVGPVTARHRIDPLPNPQRGRFRRRRGRNDSPIVVVPARPPTTRVLPRGRREDPM